MRTEDLILHPNNILGKKSIKHQIFYALCFLFWNFQFNQKQVLSPHLLIHQFIISIKKINNTSTHYRSMIQPIFNVFFNSVMLNILVSPFIV